MYVFGYWFQSNELRNLILGSECEKKNQFVSRPEICLWILSIIFSTFMFENISSSTGLSLFAQNVGFC